MDIPMNDIRFETWLDEVLEGTSYAFTECELFEMYRAGDSPAEAIQEGEDLLDDGLFG
jgi:predicted RNase H-like HicB family nuclease